MQNLWCDKTAASFIEQYAKKAVNADLALRVYTSRLLGANPALVLHGGGNTSVKTESFNLHDEKVQVVCVKGSGWDLAAIEPQGFPALHLAPLLNLQKLKNLTDEDMVNAQRCQMLDAAAPNPSIETLLHAFIPHRFIDHTHANAILSLTNQPDGDALIKKIFGSSMGIVPYIKPGFDLAKAAAEIFARDPSVKGLILLQHGIFTFADTAKEAYFRMIEAVTLAEEYIKTHSKNMHRLMAVNSANKSIAEIAPLIRGACSKLLNGMVERMILMHRKSDLILKYVNGENLQRYSQVGVITPDHIIRTKNFPLILPSPFSMEMTEFKSVLETALREYQIAYHRYFVRNNEGQSIPKKELDPLPRIILVPDVGLFALGKSAADAAINADIAENSMQAILDAEAIGNYTALPESDLFEIEYWSLEQAKLAKNSDKAFTRQVVVVTGGAGTIGQSVANAFINQGAEVVLMDIDQARCDEAAKKIHSRVLAIACDLTKAEDIQRAFDRICQTFGGVDIVVLNAGIAYTGKIGEVSDALLRKSLEINFFAHQHVAQQAISILSKQNLGGCLLFNVSKQALNPGVDFGPYGIAKAATLALMRQYAIDYAALGIRSNAVNADRIRSGLLTEEMISARAQARGVDPTEYMCGNLLMREVTAEDVANAFVHLALAEKTTAGIVTVDGGNIAAAVR